MQVLYLLGLLALCKSSIVSTSELESQVAVQEKRVQNSEVRIRVGDAPNFLYEVYGSTSSNQQITASGFYFNNENQCFGYAHLFMGSPTPIDYYRWNGRGNQVNVDIYNVHGKRFQFSVRVPSGRDPVTVALNRFNSTTLILIGPSRSQVY